MSIKPKPKLCGTCKKMKPLWRSATRTTPGICQECARIADFTPISKVSDKKKEEDKIYNKIRPVFLNSKGRCEANLTGCSGKPEQVHHKEGRIGSRYLDIKTWLAVCDGCHRIIELNPEWAKEMKFSNKRI